MISGITVKANGKLWKAKMFLYSPIMESSGLLPKDFIHQLSSVLNKKELDLFCESLNHSPPTSIRINPFKKNKTEKLQPVKWCNEGFYLDKRPSFTLDPVFHAGAYYVQEASSMFLEQAVIHSVDTKCPLRVLDLCAAPGGKSTHLLSLINNESLLVSNEVIRSRANILSENILKWGCANVMVTQNDPAHFSRLNGFFDLIVVDAPCSGEGLFRKEPEAISEWSSANVGMCSQRQKRILFDVFPALKENGILIYCTCTYNHRENEDNLKWLALEQDIEFITIPVPHDWGIQEVLDGNIRAYRFFPHCVDGEGFFISVMRKRSKETSIKIRQKEFVRPSKIFIDKLLPWIKNKSDYDFISNKDSIRLIHTNQSVEINYLESNLNVIHTGTLLGTVKHGKFIPEHALALSIHLNMENVCRYEVSEEDALRFLRKETFHLDAGQSGYALITFNNLGLGWINCLGNRTNNLYPTHWRIRMK